MGFRQLEMVGVAVLCSLTIGARLAERTSHAQQNRGPRKTEKIGRQPPMTLKHSSPGVAEPSSEPTRRS
jgi:hypothetical protein